ncbi:MAG: hypothetical protein KF687_14475 [Cyclobacteriaceae bacterium]|nr:hypothetical protein [Cyclobacteriaceae bacterium]
MNALKMKWGLAPLSSSFLGQEKTKKTFTVNYVKNGQPISGQDKNCRGQ